MLPVKRTAQFAADENDYRSAKLPFRDVLMAMRARLIDAYTGKRITQAPCPIIRMKTARRL